jgi:hypothetical protein
MLISTLPLMPKTRWAPFQSKFVSPVAGMRELRLKNVDVLAHIPSHFRRGANLGPPFRRSSAVVSPAMTPIFGLSSDG